MKKAAEERKNKLRKGKKMNEEEGGIQTEKKRN
jgi:hypothetical protein